MFLLGMRKIMFFTTPRYLKLPYHCYQNFPPNVLVRPCLFASYDASRFFYMIIVKLYFQGILNYYR
jgi:hypothetical protein